MSRTSRSRGSIGASAEVGGFVESVPEHKGMELCENYVDDDDDEPEARPDFPKLSCGSLARKDGLSQAGTETSKKRWRSGIIGESSPAQFQRQGSSPRLENYFSPRKGGGRACTRM